jgi:ethanolamine permease
MILGIAALYTNKTGEIITIAVFGALTLYIISMISLLKLRKTEPNLERPFVVPFYPILPITALLIGFLSIITMSYFNPVLALLYFGTILTGYILFKIFYKTK